MTFSSIEKQQNPVEFKDIKATCDVANYRRDDQMKNVYLLTTIKLLLLLGNNIIVINKSVCFMKHFMYIV